MTEERTETPEGATAAAPATPTGFAVRRILAAFSPATASGAALESAVEVAARLGAELEALFVEDEGLLSLAELPVVRQVRLHGPSGQVVLRTDLERDLRAHAARASRRLREAAARRQIRCSVRVTRGRMASVVTAAARDVDLLILECLSRPFGRETRVELAARAVIGQAGRSVLLVPPNRAPGPPVHVVVEHGPDALAAVRAAIMLATRWDGPLVVDLMGEPAMRARLQAQITTLLPHPSGPIEYHAMAGTGPAEVDALLASVGGGTLVLDAASPLLAAEDAWERVARAPCAVLLVR
jgi:hypothetical protein